jgi:hypothetical protein
VERWVAFAMIVLSATVTAFGVAWLSERSHAIARTGAALVERPEPVLISRVAHVFREAGWFAGDHRWLTALTDQEVEDAAAIVGDAGFDTFGLVTLDRTSPPPTIAGYAPVRSEVVPFMSGQPLRVITYVRSP